MKGKMSALLEEKKAIEEFTERLLEQRKVTFLRVFDSIREEMRKVYQELSGGGDAILYFSNENDPHGGERGAHKARPKGGTRYTRLEALSGGGEKSLTALSFIIAVQRTFPSPFYFLDEVDMFLDGGQRRQDREAAQGCLKERADNSDLTEEGNAEVRELCHRRYGGP
ncbi:hypothetical protein [Thermogymnomonas acidicola]|uniref:hypothetical protein n=1 Tax=Thermogymnomonas acidicola TaxID=399579 RepID=UPI0009465546|nr:hypothetical protein [Thermogymnomonas acidicola]